ncbi:hypothetical protein LXA43DRAFT_1099502 [Ganoderma leucocontextum]|nr:hypothetical protein LXA43DRAFT_1099502 [Ganoderma leucocontextum]
MVHHKNSLSLPCLATEVYGGVPYVLCIATGHNCVQAVLQRATETTVIYIYLTGCYHLLNLLLISDSDYVLHPKVLSTHLHIRELARSQGFPDWFVFCAHGDRLKTMHREIGNAVPWQVPVGEALARELKMAMYQKWKRKTGRVPLTSIQTRAHYDKPTVSTNA